PLVRWIDRYQKARQEARQRKHLQTIEQKGLEAQGVNAAEARAKAFAVADAMVQKAAQIKIEAPLLEPTVLPQQGVTVPGPAKVPPPQRVNTQDIFDIAATREAPTRSRTGLALKRLIRPVFGGGIRFVIGTSLLLVFLLWL